MAALDRAVPVELPCYSVEAVTRDVRRLDRRVEPDAAVRHETDRELGVLVDADVFCVAPDSAAPAVRNAPR